MKTYYKVEPFKRARQEKRLSLTQLAALIGLTEDMVRKIEKGTRPLTEKTAFKMSEVLDVPMEKVMPRVRRSA